MRQDWFLTASLLISLFAAQCVRYTDAAKFIRNRQTQECLEHTGSSGCSSVSITACPEERSALQDSLRWNVIPDDPSEPLNNASEILVQSPDASVCLTASSSVSVEACPCENGKLTQKWKLNGDNWMSASNEDRCLAVTGNEVTLGSCDQGAGQSSWDAYHTTPDGVYAYAKPLFTGEASRLALLDPLTRDDLPSEMFSGSFSLEVPPGFQLVIESGNGNKETFDSDIAQLDPIPSTAKIVISIKSGMVIYEYPTYFGTSEHFPNGFVTNNDSSKPHPIGSAMVSKGFRGIMWESKERKGTNIGLFEPIANFTGVNTESLQMSAGSFEVSSAKCSKECASGGFCSDDGKCSCRPGFAGDQCERCAAGFWGPSCESCAAKCGNDAQFTCDDGHAGTGECKCVEGLVGESCNQCAPGFFGSNCTACDCGQGLCDDNGKCTCNAGWANGPEKNCSVCDEGFYLDSGSCVACGPGCSECESGSGECKVCFSGATKDDDNPSRCIPQSSCPDGQYSDGSDCQPCDSACSTCVGGGPTDCLSCPATSYYFRGSCFPATDDGKCQADSSGGNFFASNDPESQGVCEPCPSGCSDCRYDGTFSRSTLRESLVCTQCTPGFVRDDNQCKESCPDGKYIVNGVCQECDSKCAKCTGPNENECLACTDSSLFAKNGVCSSEKCGSGFVASNTTCIQCHPDCAECSGPNADQCTRCPASRPVLNKENSCVPVCREGSYADDSGTCQPCHEDCSSCVGPGNDQCLSCSDLSRVLVAGSCTGSCPAGSVLLKTERVCMTKDNSLVAPNNNNNNNKERRRSFPWWAIVLIVLVVVGILAAAFFLYRRRAIKRRQKKMDEFGRKVDANIVEKNLQQLHEGNDVERGSSASNDLEATVRPLSKASFRTREVGVVRETMPPTYDHRDGERYWRDAFNKKFSHSDRRSARSDDWEGFEIAMLDEKGKVTTVGSPPRAAMRNGSTSRASKSTKKPNSWGENWI